MKAPKYAVYPGFVTSNSDGQRHYITAGDLCLLYGVQMRDCLVIYLHDETDPSKRERVQLASTLIALRPRFDGDYTLPTA
jgi:hypothetical protein